jgi:hypothetical protein
MSTLFAILLLASATNETAAPAAAPAAAPVPQLAAEGPRGIIRMKASQIKAYNKGLAKDHPAYIRCESQPVTGSIAMRRKVCRTNKEWDRIITQGNEEARGFVQDMNKGWTSGSLGGN